MSLHSTWQFILIGFLCALIMNAPVYAWIYDHDWSWAHGFPVGWLGACLSYMGTFFHELGHTGFAWFYGYPTIPIFDFTHGGGFAISVSGQNYLILGAVNIGLCYLIYLLQEFRGLQIAVGAVILFNLATAFSSDLRHIVIDFMGPAAEPLVASFLLFRALFDLAPRGSGERLLNAIFGFAMIIHSLIEGFALIGNDAYRLVYFQQKGTHGFGDFDKVEESISFMSFNAVVSVWIILSLICLITPFIFYMRSLSQKDD